MCGGCYDTPTSIEHSDGRTRIVHPPPLPPPPPYVSTVILGVKHNLGYYHALYYSPEIELLDPRNKPTGLIGTTEFKCYNLPAYNLYLSIPNPEKELNYINGIAWLGAKKGDIGYNEKGKPIILGDSYPKRIANKYMGWQEECIYKFRCSKCKTPYIYKMCDCTIEVTLPKYTK